MSLALCTATSTSPSSSASSISFTNSRLVPVSDSGCVCRRSPPVLITTISTRVPPACRRVGDGVGLPQREPAAARAEPDRRRRHDAADLCAGVRIGGGARLLFGREPEQAVQRLGVGGNGRLVADRLELFGRRQQQLLDDEAGDLVDAGARLRRKPGQLRLEPQQLRLADRLEPLAQRDHRRDDVARLHPRHEPGHFAVTIASARVSSAQRRARFSLTIVCRSSML